MKPRITVQQWGVIAYKPAWERQEEIFNELISNKLKKNVPGSAGTSHVLALCEHPHVFTLGKSGKAAHLLLSPEALWEDHSAEFYHNNRGGDITYHGPGQVVGYPILDLQAFTPDIHLYMRMLEEVMILTLADYGLRGERWKGATGVWLDTADPSKIRKICAMGVKSSRWVTMHGFALNVNTELQYFDLIVPCGIPDKGVTSLKKELGREVSIPEVCEKIVVYFGQVFEADMIC